MKPFKLHYKIIAFLIAFAFVFQSMSQINEHTYKTGVYNIHNHNEFIFNCLPNFDDVPHMNYDCKNPLNL